MGGEKIYLLPFVLRLGLLLALGLGDGGPLLPSLQENEVKIVQ